MNLTKKNADRLVREFRARLNETAKPDGLPHTHILSLGAGRNGKPRMAAFIVYAGYADDPEFEWLRRRFKDAEGADDE